MTTASINDWPIRPIGGTAGSSSLICDRCYSHSFADDPGEWPGEYNGVATLGELIAAVTEHSETCGGAG